jgi:hypothetical protein
MGLCLNENILLAVLLNQFSQGITLSQLRQIVYTRRITRLVNTLPFVNSITLVLKTRDECVLYLRALEQDNGIIPRFHRLAICLYKYSESKYEMTEMFTRLGNLGHLRRLYLASRYRPSSELTDMKWIVNLSQLTHLEVCARMSCMFLGPEIAKLRKLQSLRLPYFPEPSTIHKLEYLYTLSDLISVDLSHMFIVWHIKFSMEDLVAQRCVRIISNLPKLNDFTCWMGDRYIKTPHGLFRRDSSLTR